MLSLKIEGWRELSQALKDLGNDRTIRAALKRALMNKKTLQMRDYAKSLAPKRTGRMAGKIEISTTLSRRQRRQRTRGPKDNDNNSATVYIGAGAKGPAVLDEFGTKQRRHKSGKATGAAPQQPFMRPAWEAFKDQILAEFGRELGAEIEKAAKRIARKQAKLIRGGGA